ncbi:hypothetical protein [Proteocatella sphenisci]|uniref:hypothetical protein n=1 Tax=Proteocatella sphenisci TaxID=181070 RepID=UPI00048F2BFA|nr:hypothetical protein [Proteocatella sphenisci]
MQLETPEKQEKNSEEARINEFRELAKSIKARIYELAIIGNNHEAAAIIEQLQSVTPYDEELEELKKKIGME